MKKKTQLRRNLSSTYLNQIAVLRTLSNSRTSVIDEKHVNIQEIATKSGLTDEKEAQRYLFILEGQKLVAPHPEGDFTSKVWKITDQGKTTLKSISKYTIQ